MKKNSDKSPIIVHGTSLEEHSDVVSEKSEHESSLTIPEDKKQVHIITKKVGDGEMRKDDVRILEMKTTTVVSSLKSKRSTRTIMVYFAIEGKWKEIPLEKLF